MWEMSKPTTEELIDDIEKQLGFGMSSNLTTFLIATKFRLQEQADEIKVKDKCIKKFRELEKTWQEDDRLSTATEALNYIADAVFIRDIVNTADRALKEIEAK